MHPNRPANRHSALTILGDLRDVGRDRIGQSGEVAIRVLVVRGTLIAVVIVVAHSWGDEEKRSIRTAKSKTQRMN